nr:MAG TPA: hypothetical protein [Caudoviricetes sp.]
MNFKTSRRSCAFILPSTADIIKSVRVVFLSALNLFHRSF